MRRFLSWTISLNCSVSMSNCLVHLSLTVDSWTPCRLATFLKASLSLSPLNTNSATSRTCINFCGLFQAVLSDVSRFSFQKGAGIHVCGHLCLCFLFVGFEFYCLCWER